MWFVTVVVVGSTSLAVKLIRVSRDRFAVARISSLVFVDGRFVVMMHVTVIVIAAVTVMVIMTVIVLVVVVMVVFFQD